MVDSVVPDLLEALVDWLILRFILLLGRLRELPVGLGWLERLARDLGTGADGRFVGRERRHSGQDVVAKWSEGMDNWVVLFVMV